MSSTNRGARRHPDDWYETPRWCVERILPYLPRAERILEPAAGCGAIIGVITKAYRKAAIQCVELDPVRSALSGSKGILNICGDYLTFDGSLPYDLIITNPPYKLALEFVQHSLELAAEHTTIAMLLRLNWLGSNKRREFHQANPSDVYVLTPRPSFTDDKRTDSCEYAWFVWGPGPRGRMAVL